MVLISLAVALNILALLPLLLAAPPPLAAHSHNGERCCRVDI